MTKETVVGTVIGENIQFDYIDSTRIQITGTITGKSIQTGTPSPDNPAAIVSIGDIGNFDIVSSDMFNTESNFITVYSNCLSLPDGATDTIDFDTGTKMQNVNQIIFDGSSDENWIKAQIGSTSRYRFYIAITDKKVNGLANGLMCDTLNPVVFNLSSPPTAPSISGHNTVNTVSVYGTIFDSMSVSDFKSWLTTNVTTVNYPLATPVTSKFTYTSGLYGYKKTTYITIDGPVKSDITAVFYSLVYDVERYLNFITSEHSNKPNFRTLLRYLLESVDLNYLNVDEDFDLDYAVGLQLDIAGITLGISRKLTFQPSGGTSSVLNDDDYRSLLKAKITLNQWNGTMETLADALTSWNPSVYFAVKDNQDMTVDIIAVGANQLQKELIENGYIIPKPAGVKFNYNLSDEVIFAYDTDTSTLSGYDTGTWL